MEKYKVWLILGIFIFLAQNVSANFVCGEVLSSESYSSSWMDVIVYYAEKPNATTSCKISPEGKYCCDLEEISIVQWNVGKKVFAEVFELNAGFVSNRVETITTSESYTLFPQIKIGRPISFNNEFSQILINKKNQEFNITLFEGFTNLKLILENSEGIEEQQICSDCSTIDFVLNFSGGENKLSFITSREMSFVKNLSFFVLDYLNVEHNFDCDSCEFKNGYWYVPSNEEVGVKVKVSASHPFNGELLEYVPSDFAVLENDSVADFSVSHNILKFVVNNTNILEESYNLKTPHNFLQKEYIFKNEILGENYVVPVRINKFFWFGLPIYFEKEFKKFTQYGVLEKHYVSKDYPLVLLTNSSELSLIAIYSKVEGFAKASIKIEKAPLFSRKRELKIYTDLSNDEIEKILLQFKVSKEKEFSLADKRGLIELELYQEDEDYNYYQVFLERKDKLYLLE